MFQLKTHIHLYDDDGDGDEEEMVPNLFSRLALASFAQLKSFLFQMFSFWPCVALLGVITVFISLLSEYMVDAIEGTAKDWGECMGQYLSRPICVFLFATVLSRLLLFFQAFRNSLLVLS